MMEGIPGSFCLPMMASRSGDYSQGWARGDGLFRSMLTFPFTVTVHFHDVMRCLCEGKGELNGQANGTKHEGDSEVSG